MTKEIIDIEDVNEYITEIYGLVSELARQIYFESNADYIEPTEDCLDFITDWWIEVYGDQDRVPDKSEVLHGMCNYLAGDR